MAGPPSPGANRAFSTNNPTTARSSLPFAVLRRLDCVLEVTKAKVLAELAAKQTAGLNPDPFLLCASGQSFCNISPMDLANSWAIRTSLFAYVQAFSPAARDIFERFDFATQIEKLAKCGLPYQVAEKFSGIELAPRPLAGGAASHLIGPVGDFSATAPVGHSVQRIAYRDSNYVLVLNLCAIGRPRCT